MKKKKHKIKERDKDTRRCGLGGVMAVPALAAKLAISPKEVLANQAGVGGGMQVLTLVAKLAISPKEVLANQAGVGCTCSRGMCHGDILITELGVEPGKKISDEVAERGVNLGGGLI